MPSADLNATPLLSVGIPVYNGERWVAQAIDSVLAQTLDDVECIVVDDGSTDGTSAVLDRYGDDITVVRTGNLGVAAARNSAIAHGRGAYWGFLDADDYWAPEKGEVLIEALSANPNAGFAYGKVRRFGDGPDAHGISAVPDAGDVLRRAVVLEPPMVTIVFGITPSHVLKEAGGFDERLSSGADCELTVRVAASRRPVYVDRVVHHYRQHDEQMHRDPDLLERDHEAVLRLVKTDPIIRREAGGLYRQGQANLYVSLAIAHQRKEGWKPFLRYLLRAARAQPIATLRRFGWLTWQRKLRPVIERSRGRRPESRIPG